MCWGPERQELWLGVVKGQEQTSKLLSQMLPPPPTWVGEQAGVGGSFWDKSHLSSPASQPHFWHSGLPEDSHMHWKMTYIFPSMQKHLWYMRQQLQTPRALGPARDSRSHQESEHVWMRRVIWGALKAYGGCSEVPGDKGVLNGPSRADQILWCS